jgi:hypothetical protein
MARSTLARDQEKQTTTTAQSIHFVHASPNQWFMNKNVYMIKLDMWMLRVESEIYAQLKVGAGAEVETNYNDAQLKRRA